MASNKTPLIAGSLSRVIHGGNWGGSSSSLDDSIRHRVSEKQRKLHQIMNNVQTGIEQIPVKRDTAGDSAELKVLLNRVLKAIPTGFNSDAYAVDKINERLHDRTVRELKIILNAIEHGNKFGVSFASLLGVTNDMVTRRSVITSAIAFTGWNIEYAMSSRSLEILNYYCDTAVISGEISELSLIIDVERAAPRLHLYVNAASMINETVPDIWWERYMPLVMREGFPAVEVTAVLRKHGKLGVPQVRAILKGIEPSLSAGAL